MLDIIAMNLRNHNKGIDENLRKILIEKFEEIPA